MSSPGRRSTISEEYPDFEDCFSVEDLIQVEQLLKKRHGLIIEPQILRSFKKKGGKRMKASLGKMIEYLFAGQLQQRKFDPLRFLRPQFNIGRQL